MLRASDTPGRAPSSMHVIFVCLVFHPDTSASSILFTDFFRRFVRADRQVTVLCGFPSKDGDSHRELPREEWFHGIHIIRCGLRLEGKRSLWHRALSYGSFLLHAGYYLLKMGRKAIVLGGTDPPFTSIALWMLSWTRRLRYQCIMLDIYPDLLVGIGTLSETSLLVRLWKLLNCWSRRAADRVIVIGRDMIDRMERDGLARSHITYIPHWGTHEIDGVPYTPERPLLASLGLDHKFVVQYSGNMGLLHDMQTLVEAASRLREHDEIHFLFIGKGRRRAAAEALAQHLGLSNITWLDFLPREQLVMSLLSCDAAVVSLRDGLEGTAVPSKLYGILASGRPVIAQVPARSEISLTVQEHDCGVVVPPGNADALAGAILAISSDREAARAMGKRGHIAYHTSFTVNHAVRAFDSLWRPTTPEVC